MKIRAHLLQVRLFDSPVSESQTNLVQRPGVLTNTMIGLAGLIYPLLEVFGEGDAQATWQSSLPGHELPLAPALAIFATLHKGSVDLDLRTRQMLPLIPGGIPYRVQGCRIKPEFELPANVPAQR